MHKWFNKNNIDWDMKIQCCILSCIIVVTMGSAYGHTKNNVIIVIILFMKVYNEM
jgi:hypothetical protein